MSFAAPISSHPKKATVKARNISNDQPTSSIFQGLQCILCFGRSLFAEWIVYILVYHSISAIVTFFLFLPLDLTCAVVSGDWDRGYFIRLHIFLFVFPTGNFALEAFPLGTRILLTGLWILSVRPSLALAGWIVNKRLPAYTLPSENYPPIRWGFEYICCVVNQHHLLVPDLEFYARQAIRFIGIRVSSDSYQLGTISEDELDELRDFSNIFHTVMEQYSAKGTSCVKEWYENYADPNYEARR
ncbi:hypothetical protein GCG54_00011757 [Colletotrichum gloeosporioides]|uniref:Uncharacterized protein n=1 Tax=Colletotrichum gloeosporioides TaxID=474922 RepID=A0A8H4FIH8_COLGL|nr:uncharacterized protein GCG54_00011757 [Colletotrichum gloeosporioides]KAF3803091.1 hypothetical protein GCG54_00011757 [Colletotrichum gloeosporioides]